jgi:hypothetical protein
MSEIDDAEPVAPTNASSAADAASAPSIQPEQIRISLQVSRALSGAGRETHQPCKPNEAAMNALVETTEKLRSKALASYDPDPFDAYMIALDVRSYQHRNREYGRIKVPQFTPRGWAPKAQFNEALLAAGFAPADEPPASQEETQAEEINGAIPF